MRLLHYCFVFFFSVFFGACHKSKTKPAENAAQPAAVQAPDESSVSSAPSFRGVYVDNFLNIFGRQSGEDSLLNWCLKNNLNAMSLYNVASIVATPANASLLNDFIGKAQSAPYNMQVSAIASNIIITANEYTRYYKIYPNKFSAITTEYEFWNSGKSYTTFGAQLNYMQAIHDSTGGALKRQTYFSQFEDAEGFETEEAAIAQRMVSSSDKIFLVNYVADSYNLSSTTLNKIITIAAAANALNKRIEIVILFNVNANSIDPDISDYFSASAANHPFSDAYKEFKSDYDAVSFPNKASVKLVGFQLYKFSAAYAARPAL